MLLIESKLRDRGNPQGALDDLAAFGALGQRDSARAVLSALAAKFPASQGIRAALERLP